MVNLEVIRRSENELTAQYKDKLQVNTDLNRTLVSFQANKKQNGYRWFKYKEAFSARLVEHLLDRCGVTGGVLLDPFAGIGTALFAAGEMGLQPEGIELLPVGQRVISTKQRIDWDLKPGDAQIIAGWAENRPWRESHSHLIL